MYSLEHEAQPDVFKNAFSGIWWSASTLLTVGYGDIYPVTTMGRVFGIFITFLGVGMVAIPTGIISAGFVEQYQQFKRFGDYGMEQDIRYIQISLTIRDRWVGRSIRSLGLPRGSMVAAVQRGDQLIIPNGDVVLTPGDVLMIAAEQITKGIPMRIQEIILRKNHPWTGSSIRDLDMSRQSYIIMVKREGTARIPDGEMVLQEGDQIYVLSKEKRKRIED
jgi:voltage-gated potassium channel